MDGPVPGKRESEKQRDRETGEQGKWVTGVRRLPSTTGSCGSTGPSGRAGGETMLSDL